MKNKNSYLMMAFASGQDSTTTNEVKRYIGVAPVVVKSVNPNKEELEKLYNTKLEKEPEYITSREVNGKIIPQVRIDFIISTDAEKCNGIDFTTKVSFFISKEQRFNRDQSKIQVIDKYGRTAWVTRNELANHDIPMYSLNQPALLDKDYRPCYMGEEDLTNFISAYLSIPMFEWIDRATREIKRNPNVTPEDCQARLDNIENYFKGDYKELKTIVTLRPTNKVKVLFGVKTSNDNKQYQAVYTQMFIKNNINNEKAFERFNKDLIERKAAGAYPTTEFNVCPLEEYQIVPTKFEQQQAASSNQGSEESWPF